MVVFAIDPLLASLAHFDTSEDLTERIHLLFRVLDGDENGSLSFEELRCVAVSCGVWQRVAVCCGVVQCVAASGFACSSACSTAMKMIRFLGMRAAVLQRAAVHCSALQCGAVRCGALQCVAVFYSVFQYVVVLCGVCVRELCAFLSEDLCD